MPRYNTVRYNQKWSLYNTWSAGVRRLKIIATTTQYRLIRTFTAQNRFIAAATSQYRRIIGRTGG